jgi:hypothetical protein
MVSTPSAAPPFGSERASDRAGSLVGAGETLCEVYQRVMTARIVICQNQIAKWGLNAADLHVAIVEGAIAVTRAANKQPLMQVRTLQQGGWEVVCTAGQNSGRAAC